MIPFRTDPHWYEEHWYGDPPDESGPEAPPQRHAGRLGRIAASLARVAAVPARPDLGDRARRRNPVPDADPAYQD